MNRLVSCLIISVLLWSCEKNRGAAEELNVYFDLDSILDAQVIILSERGVPVTKTVIMDGEVETQTQPLDSLGWEDEFAIIRDFDLNQPYNVGAYKTSETEGGTYYELSDKTLDAPVRYFTVERADNVLEIVSEYFEDRTIYQHRRKLQLILENGLLKSYEISGFQKMVLKDTIRYRIKGEVRIDE